jgi:hypothetical protein
MKIDLLKNKIEILENFDFKKVHDAMLALKWEWYQYHGIPTIDIIKTEAEKLLDECINNSEKKISISTGGFTVRKYKHGLSLKFIVEEWDTGTS